MRRLPEGYAITGADAEDVPALVEINLAADELFAGTGLVDEASLTEHVPETVLEDAIAMRHLFVARFGQVDPVGFALTSVREGVLYLDQVSVHPDHGRKGIGAALVDRVVADARDRKLGSVVLSTFRELPWNGPFYKKLGFKEIKPEQLAPWMQELEATQAESLDVSKRCFMRRRARFFAFS